MKDPATIMAEWAARSEGRKVLPGDDWKPRQMIRALEAEGWRLVKEPTPEMLDAARKHLGITTPLRAALSAAPRWSGTPEETS